MEHLNRQFTPNVQDEANQYFQQIYAKQDTAQRMTVNEFVHKLKSFRDGDDHQKDVFDCMLKNLFEEYQYFHQYPQREFDITAEVFGRIVNDQVVLGPSLGTCLRYIVQACQHKNKMFSFGVRSLDECKTRLRGYPKYCEYIARLELFPSFPAVLRQYVIAGQRGQLPSPSSVAPPPMMGLPTPQIPFGSMNSGTFGGAASPQPTPISAFTPVGQSPGAPPTDYKAAANVVKTPSLQSTSIAILLSSTDDDKMVAPSEKIVEKMAFIFNNLSMLNLPKKVDEMKVLMVVEDADSGEGSEEEEERDYFPWLAQYLVMKRVSIEHNFHRLYGQLLTTFNCRILDRAVLKETFRNIRILLRADKRHAQSNFSDRQLLKNLGHWLGMVTIARDIPIMYDEVDLRSLLMEAFYKGQQELLYVVPFVAKVLESCDKSVIFRPDNAWVMSLLQVLAELHGEHDMKLNLKFEIEVLCKALGMELTAINKEGVLKSTNLLPKRQQLNDLVELNKPQSALTSSFGASPLPAQASMFGAINLENPPTLKYDYAQIDIVNISSTIAQHVTVNDKLPLLQRYGTLALHVKNTVEQLLRDCMPPVVDKAIKVAMTTTEHIVSKDHAVDPEGRHVVAAAHHMMRSLTAGMAMIFCQEALNHQLFLYMKNAFHAALTALGEDPSDKAEKGRQLHAMVEEAAFAVAMDNIQLAVAITVKTASQKGLHEINKRLEGQLEERARARTENREFGADSEASRMVVDLPAALRMPTEGPTSLQLYEQFSSNISAFKATTAQQLATAGYDVRAMKDVSTIGVSHDAVTQSQDAQSALLYASIITNRQRQESAPDTSELTSMLNQLLREVESVLASKVPTVGGGTPNVVDTAAGQALGRIAVALREANQTGAHDAQSMSTLVMSTTQCLLFGYQLTESHHVTSPLKEAFVLVCKLAMSVFGGQWLQLAITRALIDCRHSYRYNVDALNVLLRMQLVALTQYDQLLVHLMEGGSNSEACNFVGRLFRAIIAEPKSPVQPKDLPNAASALHSIGHSTASDSVELIHPSEEKMTAADLLSSGGGASIPLSRLRLGDDDPPDLQQKCELILKEWINMAYTMSAHKDPANALATIVNIMRDQGVLRTDDVITRFFRLCTEMCVEMTYRLLAKDGQPVHLTRQKCFHTLDAFVKLASLMIKCSGGQNIQTKVDLLKKILNIITTVLLTDAQVRGAEFNQLPYHRLIIMLFWELTTPDAVLEQIQGSILDLFGNALFLLQPRRVPAFAYAWLEIVGHRHFIGQLLAVGQAHQAKSWAMYIQLIICHLKFLAPFLRNIDLPKPIALMYKGTLRVLLVLLHDFPELLCDYHFSLCDAIPPNCVQLRNLVLSAYPRNMRLPDPFMPQLEVRELREITQSPKIAANLNQIIPEQLRTDIDSYLSARSPVTFLQDLPSKLVMGEGHSTAQSGRYNVSQINAIVLYVGMRAIEHVTEEKAQKVTPTTIAHTPFMDIFQNLALCLDTEGRYLFFNAIANQLRYPNAHTHYFSCTLLYLFREANSQVIQEQITRILFERLVALRPHPWGLLTTFIDLIKDDEYGFWKLEFTRCAPEIERLFQSVAQSCMVRTGNQTLVDPAHAVGVE